MRKLKIILAVLVAVALVGLAGVGCGGATPTATPSPSPTAKPSPTPTTTPVVTPTTSPTASPKPSPSPTAKLPAVIGLTTYASGSKGYMLHSGMAHAIEVKTGMKVRVVPGGSNTARAMAVISGECLLGAHCETGFYSEQSGIWDFKELGPQKLSIVWVGAPASTSFITRADSGIKSFADIKGKRVANLGNSDLPSQAQNTAQLAYAGLTWKDVTPFMTNSAGAYKSIIDGTADVAYGTPGAADVFTLASSMHGAYVFQFPPDKDAWARANASFPIIFPAQYTAGGYGASAQNPQWWVSFVYAIFARTDADEAAIYAVVKSFVDGFDLYKDAHPEAPLWNLENATNISMLNWTGLPYHPGAIKALKETGKWTAKHDQWQQSRIQFNEQVRKAYSDTVDEAAAKKISVGSDQFEAIWMPKWEAMRRDLIKTQY